MRQMPSDIHQPIIDINNIHKSFGKNHVLRGFSLQVQPHESVAVLGKSGSGKSVLIKCVIGLLGIDKGHLTVLGKEINRLTGNELNDLRGEVGFQFQGSALYDSMTVRENLEFPLRRHPDKMRGLNSDDVVEEALDAVGLLAAIDLMPAELSGGMKKRIALARTLILRPQIILYDEPTSGLDPVTSREISLLIRNIQQKFGAAAIIITHDLLCARVAGDRLLLLNDGVAHAQGSYEEFEKSEDPIVKAFFS